LDLQESQFGLCCIDTSYLDGSEGAPPSSVTSPPSSPFETSDCHPFTIGHHSFHQVIFFYSSFQRKASIDVDGTGQQSVAYH
jgi:hypothetical protein